MKWHIVDGILAVNDRKFFAPESRKVIKVEKLGEHLITLLDWMPDPAPTDNVVCLDANLKILWRIKPLPMDNRPNSIVNIWLEEAALFARFWIGVDVIVNPTTGEWVNASPGTRPW